MNAAPPQSWFLGINVFHSVVILGFRDWEINQAIGSGVYLRTGVLPISPMLSIGILRVIDWLFGSSVLIFHITTCPEAAVLYCSRMSINRRSCVDTLMLC